MHPVLFKLGSISIYSHDFTLVLALGAGLYLVLKGAKRFGIEARKILRLSPFVLLCAILGARLFFVLSHMGYYLDRPSQIIMIQNGGLSFYGGFIVALLFGFWILKKNHLPLAKGGDLVAPSLALGAAIMRIGCLLNGCCYGKITNLPWAVTFPHLFGPRHPTQIYFFISNLTIFFILLVWRRTRKKEGEIFWLYLLLYSGTRFILESFRAAEGNLLFFNLLNLPQLISIALFVLALTRTDHFKKFKICLVQITKAPFKNIRSRVALTLIELMVVVLIIGILGSIVYLKIIPHRLEASKDQAAQAEMNTLSIALEMYRSDLGRYPSTANSLGALIENLESFSEKKNWNGPYMQYRRYYTESRPGWCWIKKESKIPVDPWGNPYVYGNMDDSDGRSIANEVGEEIVSGACLIVSQGADGEQGTDDDIMVVCIK